MLAPILIAFDPEKETVVETDASDYALGGVISQKGEDGKLHPIAFYSRKLTSAELNYEIHDKELLAIVECLREWRVYLEGSKYRVKVYSDHKNLLYFMTMKVLKLDGQNCLQITTSRYCIARVQRMAEQMH